MKRQFASLITIGVAIVLGLPLFLIPEASSPNLNKETKKQIEIIEVQEKEVNIEEIIQQPVITEQTKEIQKTETKKTVNTKLKVSISKLALGTPQNIWNKLKSFGWSDEVCAGIMGNMECENRQFNPTLSGCGFGICQWTNGRYKLLIKKYGKTPTVENEIDYIKWEIENGQFSGNVELFFNSKTPEQAALKFAKCFERCGGSYKKRQNFARKWYNTFKPIE